MARSPHRSTPRLRLLPAAALAAWAVTAVTALSACKDDDSLSTADIDSHQVPTMVTRDVETLISDSGVTRYRIITPVWYVYDRIDEPYWRFPEGLELQKYDNFFRTEATVKADSALYFKNRQLWRLDGNVNISNVLGEKFLTTQLFWDQRAHKLYSDSFIHIERTDRVLEGYGFESNENMTNYHIKRVAGIFPASEFKRRDPAKAGEPDESDETDNQDESGLPVKTPTDNTPHK